MGLDVGLFSASPLPFPCQPGLALMTRLCVGKAPLSRSVLPGTGPQRAHQWLSVYMGCLCYGIAGRKWLPAVPVLLARAKLYNVLFWCMSAGENVHASNASVVFNSDLSRYASFFR